MAAQQPQLGYLQEAVQAASAQPSLSLQNAVINQMAQDRQLNDLQRQAIFEAAKVQDVGRINQAQSFFSALLNEATGGLTQEITPENPNQGIPNAAAHLGAGIGIPLALTVGTALTGPVGLAAAPFVPGAYNALKGVARSYSEAQDLGQQWSPGWGLARGAAEGALTYLPVNKAKQGLGLAGQLAKNAGIAGLVEGVLSAGSQAAQAGSVSLQRLGADVAGSVGGQLGGDVLERFGGLFKIASRQQQAADVAKQVASQLGLKKRADLAPSVKVQANPVDVARAEESVTGRIVPRDEANAVVDQFAKLQQQINTLLSMGQGKQAIKIAQALDTQASRLPDTDPQKGIYRQQAATIKQQVNQSKMVAAEEKQAIRLLDSRQNLPAFEADGNTTRIAGIRSQARTLKVEAKTDNVRQLATELEAEADAALGRLKTPKPQAMTAEEKVIANIEKVEADYETALQRGDVRTLKRLEGSMNKIASDSKTEPVLREYADQLRKDIKTELDSIKAQEAQAKAIQEGRLKAAAQSNAQAIRDEKTLQSLRSKQLRGELLSKQELQTLKDKQAAASNKQLNKDEQTLAKLRSKQLRGELLNKQETQALKDAQAAAANKQMSKDEETLRAIRTKKLKGQMLNDQEKQFIKDKQAAQTNRQANKDEKTLRALEAKKIRAGIKERLPQPVAKELKPKAEPKKLYTQRGTAVDEMFTPRQDQLNKTYDGSKQTIAEVDKVAQGSKPDQVLKADYFAEKVGESANKRFRERKLSIIERVEDSQGRVAYRTLDQENGTVETRKLFDGPEDSRMVALEPTNEKPKFRYDAAKGEVIEIATGKPSTFVRGEAVATSQRAKDTELLRGLFKGTKAESGFKKMTNEERAIANRIISQYVGKGPEEVSQLRLDIDTPKVSAKMTREQAKQFTKDVTGFDC